MPSASEAAVRETPVSISFALTLADGTPAPDGSVMVPLMRAVTWPRAGVANPRNTRSPRKSQVVVLCERRNPRRAEESNKQADAAPDGMITIAPLIARILMPDRQGTIFTGV